VALALVLGNELKKRRLAIEGPGQQILAGSQKAFVNFNLIEPRLVAVKVIALMARQLERLGL
tara:strand:- start:2170 stop:2355 length:186 start_codon:yes stop_codon:yes gene_type:complete